MDLKCELIDMESTQEQISENEAPEIIQKTKKTNDFAWSMFATLMGHKEPILATVKHCKLVWSSHMT